MNRVTEIETALRQLPTQDRWEVARWLLEDLQETALGHPTNGGDDHGTAIKLPDYSARRRMIFADKVLPNMVLEARVEERW